MGGIAKDMKSYIDIEATISITDDGLEDIRETESAVVLARSRRDTAATTISVTAEKQLALDVDGVLTDGTVLKVVDGPEQADGVGWWRLAAAVRSTVPKRRVLPCR